MLTVTTGASLAGLFSITKTLRRHEPDKKPPCKLIMNTTQTLCGKEKKKKKKTTLKIQMFAVSSEAGRQKVRFIFQRGRLGQASSCFYLLA